MFDLLVSSSVVVDDVAAGLSRARDALGVLEPRPSWYAAAPGLNAVFCRVHPSMAIAPTRLELIAPAPVEANPGPIRFYVPELVALMGERPIRSHATALATSAQSDVIDRLAKLNVRHRIDPAPAGMWPLVWLGVSEAQPTVYDASVDAGLMIEIVATESLRLPPETFAGDPGVPADLPAGAMVRMVARGFLVGDLDAALAALSHNLGWEPAGPVTAVPDEGYRRAAMAFNIAHSAALELIEPTGDGPAAQFMARWGPGPYHTRISVTDLQAKADDLRRRGTAFKEVAETAGLPGPLLRVSDIDTLGALFEFVEHDERDRSH